MGLKTMHPFSYGRLYSWSHFLQQTSLNLQTKLDLHIN